MPQTPVTIFLIVGPFIGTTSARPSAGTNEGGPLFYQATPTSTAAAPGPLPGQSSQPRRGQQLGGMRPRPWVIFQGPTSNTTRRAGSWASSRARGRAFFRVYNLYNFDNFKHTAAAPGSNEGRHQPTPPRLQGYFLASSRPRRGRLFHQATRGDTNQHRRGSRIQRATATRAGGSWASSRARTPNSPKNYSRAKKGAGGV